MVVLLGQMQRRTFFFVFLSEAQGTGGGGDEAPQSAGVPHYSGSCRLQDR